MAQTISQIERIARNVASKIYVDLDATAEYNLSQIVNAVQAIDNAMNATVDQASAAGYGSDQIKVAMFHEMQNSMPGITVKQAAIALALWALEEAGL